MISDQENIFYYITCMNENYTHPPIPKNCEKGILKGMYLLKKSVKQGNGSKPQLMGSGTILREVEKAAISLKRILRFTVIFGQ